MSREKLQEWREYERALATYHADIIHYVNDLEKEGDDVAPADDTTGGDGSGTGSENPPVPRPPLPPQ